MFWLGIDGGGTKTACSLYSDDLEMIDRLVLPTCHYAQAGFDGMRDVLQESVRWAEGIAAGEDKAAGEAPATHDGVTVGSGSCDSAAPDGAAGATGASFGGGNPSFPLPSPSPSLGIGNASSPSSSPVPSLGIGFAICGYGEGEGATRRIEQIVAEVAGAHPHTLVNDVEAAWAAGLDLNDGIAVIAGTGSIALGVRGDRQLRCGGWDYELGDEGSGGWLGKELLHAFTRQADERDPRGPLYELVRAELNLQDDFDVIAFAQAHYGNRGRIAALSPLVSRAAEAGDASALNILARAAQEEADLVHAIMRALWPQDSAAVPEDEVAPDSETSVSVPVTYIGGTFKAGSLILDPLRAALPSGCTLVAPAHEPDLGPVLLLRRQMGVA